MKYNQFSYIPVSTTAAKKELESLGFDMSNESFKVTLEQFVRRVLSLDYKETDQALAFLLADFETDLLAFFQSERPVTKPIFEMIALQLLGFIPNVDFSDIESFSKAISFPITFDNNINNLHQLLATRTKSGNTLIDSLVAKNIIPVTNDYFYFNGKSLATFDTSNLIREVVYVESGVDTDCDGQIDLIKVSIIRPKTKHQLPVMMTSSPYHQGINNIASDKATHKMEGTLLKKTTGHIALKEPSIKTLKGTHEAELVEKSEETFLYPNSYTLNDYMLARGFASIYVSGIGTYHSDGFMTTGDYYQVEAYKSVIDWLNNRTRAFTSHDRKHQIKATWATGKVATSGISYLGTMSNALATTGVDGLEVVIAEAGISSWYYYYRENGLITSPGGYPGEDLDTLIELTYSRNLAGGDYLRHNKAYQSFLADKAHAISRETGDYSQFWHDRNYLINTDKVKAHMVYTHGTQDWNVKPINVFSIFNSLPDHVQKHLFLHHGAHVYMNAWQSIDFRESMNTLLSQVILGQDSHYHLPTVVWQDNQESQTWQPLDHFNGQKRVVLSLGEELQTVKNQYQVNDFSRYGKSYNVFKTELFEKKANAIVIDIVLDKDIHINGRPKLNLKLKSSTDKGLLSAQLLEFGNKKYLQDIPAAIGNTVDNGRLFQMETLKELPFKEAPYRVISKGHLNLQNRDDLLTIKDVNPNEWMTFSLELQPSLYRLNKGDRLRVLLYTTDFEHTIRDNSDYQLTVDLKQSLLELPIN